MTKEQAINTAARWWTDKLKARERHDNGDKSMASVLACALADLGVEKVSMEQYEIFERELRKYIADDINFCIENNKLYRTSLGCDYDPTEHLRDAAETARISIHNFPFKTWMIIETHKNDRSNFEVFVSDGYAQPYQNINYVE